ncbi:MAG: FecR domain-containing protein [FCB group bacterium]|nr:FecR domain-containing protein [FCB group bacterium]
MKRIIFLLGLAFSIAFGGQKIGVLIKITGDVQLTRAGQKTPSVIKPGFAIEDQDLIKTGEGGFATAVYLDDRTQIKVAPNSEFKFGGQRRANGINKKVAMNYGTLRATVAKQRGKEFLVATPTSVASVKGTDFIVIADPDAGDAFLILEGIVEVTNNLTGITQTVTQNQTANSSVDGNVDVTETNTEDIPVIDESENQGGAIESNEREVRIEMTDPNGTVKELVIRFR